MRNTLKLMMGLVLLCGLMLAGCQPTTGLYLGAKALPATVVPLPDALKAEQHWRDLYVRVDYRIQQQGNRLTATGVFSFADYPQLNMARVQDFKLKLFLLNKDQLVVDYLDLYRTLGHSLRDGMAFSKTLEISPEVTALSFGYEGDFIDDNGTRDHAWKLPKRHF
ncbi:MAG TPA: hypothetical protein VIR78_08720 [Malonomonas sp.]